MTTPRFFVDEPLAAGAEMPLPQAAAHHALRVLRLGEDDALTLFNGRGGEAAARIVRASGDLVRVRIESLSAMERESPLAIILAQGISSGDRMDYTLQKATELGVASIRPVTTRRTVVKLAGERAGRRVQHWNALVTAACEQCGRNRIPPVAEIADLAHWLNDPPSGLKLVLAAEGNTTLADLPRPDGPVILLAGPEGGFAPDEAAAAQHAGFTTLRLGPRILRTETAAVAALAAMQALWGDFAASRLSSPA